MTSSPLSKITDPILKDTLRIKSAMNGKPYIGPKSVSIHAISVCNKRSGSNQPSAGFLDIKVLMDVLQDCREMGVDEIYIEGGEVTLYPHWTEAFRCVHHLGMKLAAGSHLDFGTEYLPGLCLADQLTVNISAVTEKSFQIVHGTQSSMPRVLKNLERLLAIRNTRGKPDIVLMFFVYEHNFQQLPEFIEMARKLKIDQVQILFDKEANDQGSSISSKDSLDSLKKIVDDLMLSPLAIKNNLKNFQQMISTARIIDKRLIMENIKDQKMSCYVGWFYPSIDEKGRVLGPCYNFGMSMGNVNERRFKDIWFDNDLMHNILLEASNGIDPTLSKWEKCRNCGSVSTNRFLGEKIRRTKA